MSSQCWSCLSACAFICVALTVHVFSYLFSCFYVNGLHVQLCACVCVCTSACVCSCSVLIQGSGWSCRPRGRSLAKPTQFFHIRHCNCSPWPGCLRLGTHTHNLTLTHTHTQGPGTAKSIVLIINQWCVAPYLFLLSSANSMFGHSLETCDNCCHTTQGDTVLYCRCELSH